MVKEDRPKPRYYAAVWIDFLHHYYAGKIALNVQEATKKGQPMETHRVHEDAALLHLFTEDKIIERVLPGAIHFTAAESTKDESCTVP